MQLLVKVKSCAMVHPGSSVLPESDSSCSRSVVCSVNICWYDEWSCPHSIGLRPELREIYCYYEARAVPVR